MVHMTGAFVGLILGFWKLNWQSVKTTVMPEGYLGLHFGDVPCIIHKVR